MFLGRSLLQSEDTGNTPLSFACCAMRVRSAREVGCSAAMARVHVSRPSHRPRRRSPWRVGAGWRRGAGGGRHSSRGPRRRRAPALHRHSNARVCAARRRRSRGFESSRRYGKRGERALGEQLGGRRDVQEDLLGAEALIGRLTRREARVGRQGTWYRVQGTGCRVQGAGYRVQGAGAPHAARSKGRPHPPRGL